MDEKQGVTKEVQMESEAQPERTAPSKRTLFSVGLTVFLTFLACLIVFFLFYRFQGFVTSLNNLLVILQPVLFGAIGAYLINPIMKVYEKKLLSFFLPRGKDEKKTRRAVRNLAVTLGLITFLLIIVAIICIIVPQMVNNISDLTKSVPKEIARFTTWLNDNSDAPAVTMFTSALTSFTDWFVGWLKSDFLSEALGYIGSIANGVYITFKSILNLLIGIVVAVYILTTKESFIGQSKKILYAVFKPETGNKIIHVARRSNEIFGGFVIGKIIDSLIIGVIAYISLKILQMPYPALLASIIGVTNIIPFFGPFIGAVPCLILVVLYNPLKALYLLIFIIVLQQVDGNIIGPKILGDYTGLSSFWVIFSILIGGGFFGIIGMILGVPVFAVIYYLLKKLFEGRLKKKGLPTPTSTYVRAVKIDGDTNTLLFPEDMKNQETDAIQEDSGRGGFLSRWKKKK